MNSALFWTVFPLWMKAFLFTLAVEIPIFVLLSKRFLRNYRTKREPTLSRLVLAAAFGTCFTHPALWFVWPRFVRDYTTYILTGELLVAVIESVTFFVLARPIRLHHAFIVSFSANAVSWGLGALLNTVLH